MLPDSPVRQTREELYRGQSQALLASFQILANSKNKDLRAWGERCLEDYRLWLESRAAAAA